MPANLFATLMFAFGFLLSLWGEQSHHKQVAHELLQSGISEENHVKAIETLLALASDHRPHEAGACP